MSTERSRLSARRFNKFLERASQAVLAVGLAIATAAIIALLDGEAANGEWGWGAIGSSLVLLSMALPFVAQSEE